MEQMNYKEFLDRKSQLGTFSGFEPLWIPDFLFDFQKFLVDWAIRKGKAAIFADCGLGKTPMQLVWAENVVRKTNKRVLILTPLAVSHQTIQEANKFNIQARRSDHGESYDGINVINYERLHFLNTSDFVGCVCDESSILKNFDGKRRGEITEFMKKIPYRLLCTATAAPNDYIELGTSAEALGELGFMDMLNRFFVNDQHTSDSKARFAIGGKTPQQWRIKKHAEVPFWRWVSSWARALRMPSDMGFDNNGFILPTLNEKQYLVKAQSLPSGMLFPLPAVGLDEQREERRRTIKERCQKIAELVSNTNQPALVWCHLNSEGDLLEKIIPDSEQISGDDSDDSKEKKILNFVNGQTRVLVTKPKIGAWGLNFQHCSHVTFFPSHSFEQYYQGVRRCWRYGQTRKVKVDIVTTEGEQNVMRNLQRKSNAADKMFSSIVEHMKDSLSINRSQTFPLKEEVPKWL